MQKFIGRCHEDAIKTCSLTCTCCQAVDADMHLPQQGGGGMSNVVPMLITAQA